MVHAVLSYGQIQDQSVMVDHPYIPDESIINIPLLLAFPVAELEQAIACHATMYQKFPAKICGKRKPIPSDVQYSILSFERK